MRLLRLLLSRQPPHWYQQAFLNARQPGHENLGQIVAPGLVRKAAQSRHGDDVGRAAALIVRNGVPADVELYCKFKLSHTERLTQASDGLRNLARHAMEA
ncbi:MAG TPA: hypothetical protein VKB79_28485 [Bryobacteraceae bacterium]|nr:hypothetical protein [Bryobacteraceae bacterium]